jgi:hypothetical protein
MAPNFFVEAKGHDGSIPVATCQACYDGALGARAMHFLQQFGTTGSNNSPAYYDNIAFTMTSAYHSGILGLYTTHPTSSRSNDDNPDHHHTDYVVMPLGKWVLNGSPEAYRQGTTAYRNASDLANQQRNRFIKLAKMSGMQLVSGSMLWIV